MSTPSFPELTRMFVKIFKNEANKVHQSEKLTPCNCHPFIKLSQFENANLATRRDPQTLMDGCDS